MCCLLIQPLKKSVKNPAYSYKLLLLFAGRRGRLNEEGRLFEDRGVSSNFLLKRGAQLKGGAYSINMTPKLKPFTVFRFIL